MMMTDQLTADDLKVLQRPFTFEQHKFTRGFAYIREKPTADRIEEVDPAWSMSEPVIHYMNNQAIASLTLTIKGVSRGGVGMGALSTTNKDTGVINEAADPAKSAATDAFRRAARMFGIGRYILDAPKGETDFERWLLETHGIKRQQQQRGGQQSQPQQQQGQNAPQRIPPMRQSAGYQQQVGDGAIPPDWKIVERDTAQFFADKGAGAEFAQAAVIERGKAEGWLHDRMTTALAILAVRDNREVKAAHWTSDAEALENFITWALGWMATKKDVLTALIQSVDYTMKKNEDYRGTKLEAMAAVVAYFGNYQKAQIQAAVSKAADIAPVTKPQIVTLAVQLVDHKPQLAVQPDPVTA